jgi:hypothetical protein
MKRVLPLILFLAALSSISGFLLTRGSWLERRGMHWFHKEYLFMNTWWEGTTAVFVTLLVLLIIHAIFQRILFAAIGKAMHTILLLAALTGLYLTYYDFHHDFTHKLMGQRFHMGFYLFWLGWIGICIFYLFSKKRVRLASISADKKA